MNFFVMRKDHIAALDRAAEEVFASEVVVHLRKNHHKVVGEIPEDKLRQMVEVGIGRARRNRLTMDTSITAFVALMFEVAPNFDEHPRVRQFLVERNTAPDDAIFQLSDYLTAKDWEEASRLYSPSAWREGR